MFKKRSGKLKMHLFRILGRIWHGKNTEFTFPRIMHGKHRILLILPRHPDALRVVRRWRERILFAIGNKKIVVLSLGAPLEIVEEWSQDYIFFTDSDINSLGLASRRVIDIVKKKKFKISIDLSPDFDFATAQVPLRAKIPTRIGIVNGEISDVGERFFSIFMCPSPKIDYENVAELIGTDRI